MSLAVKPGFQSGSYIAAFTTGVLAATLAADAVIASMRVGPTQAVTGAAGAAAGLLAYPRFAYVTEVSVRFSGTVAFTAIQQFGLYLQRFNGSNLSLGAGASIGAVNESGAPNSVCLPGGPEGGECRVATTVALGVVGVVFDGKKIPIYGWSGVGPNDYGAHTLSFTENPIRLGLGEGLALQNSVVWPAAGAGFVTGYIKWDERSV